MNLLPDPVADKAGGRTRSPRNGQAINQLDQGSVGILRYQYDANGRLTKRWSSAKGHSHYSYDAAGNLTRVD